jgi:hypothetical protein
VNVSKLIEVPHDALSHEALRGVAEEYVTRPGTGLRRAGAGRSRRRSPMFSGSFEPRAN